MINFKEEMMNLAKISLSKKEMKRDVFIAFKYFGWDGLGGSSMQLAGSEYGLTRERVRQITGKVVSKMIANKEGKTPLLKKLLEMISDLSPASADRVEEILKPHGLNGQRIEGVLNAARCLEIPGSHLRIVEDFGVRFVVSSDMVDRPRKIMSMAQKAVSHKGLINIELLKKALPETRSSSAYSFIRDVISVREDTVWLDKDHTWVWFKDAPRNRLITCLSKMLSVFTTTDLNSIREGANRYYRKGKRTSPEVIAPDNILINFINSWGHVSYSKAGIIRKKDIFEAVIDPLDMEQSIALFILNQPGKIAREKELENAIVPDIDGETHPKKYNFSIALNYSPLVRKGEKRGQYVANGTI